MILIVIGIVSSLVMLDTNLVAVALPTIASSLNADFADLQWVITAYVLPFAALLLAAGSFGDRVGRRRAALIGLVLFGLASLACGLSVSPLMLDISRAVQGVGASLLLTATLAIINHTFVGPERAKAYAFWGASLGVAITCGPILGGVISSLFGWQWAFLINVPLCSVLIVATLKVVPESRDPGADSLDYGGILTFSSGLFLLTWAVIDGNASGWLAPAVMWRAVGGLLLLAAFVMVEKRQSNPMLDFKIFGSRYFCGTVASMMGYAVAAQVMIFYLPLYLQNAFGFAPMTAGFAMLPFALPMFLVPRLSANITLSSRALLSLGLGVTAAGDMMMALLCNAGASYPLCAVAMVITGTGAGILNGETAKAVQGALPANRSGVASGIAATIRFTTLLFGIAALGAILLSSTLKAFVPHAGSLGWSIGQAVSTAKRFCAGDAASIETTVMGLLRSAFESGFASAAWAAVAVAIIALVVTRTLMAEGAPATSGSEPAEALFVADE
ncbi:EmrB/QacA subfamily drug resistance transporter [Pseudomonas sp. M47T1]|nr:EmrB/QacA subfamily drug resistance transporter [Pseudomonas sp. M47T1]